MNVEADPIEGAAFNATWREPVNKKTLISYFFISSGTPLGVYLAYFHFIPILKENFGYSSGDIIKHNFFLAFMPLITSIVLAYLSYRIHPLKIQKIKSTFGLILLIILPVLIMVATSPIQFFLIQSLILIFRLEESPSTPIFYSHFPVYCRFISATLLFSTSNALIYVITSFGMIYLVKYFGSFGIWVIALPIGTAYLFGLSHFKALEIKYRLYPNLS